MATVATVATPAGSLHCQKDSYARELATTVLECAEYKAEPVAAAGKKKKKETPAGPVVPTYRVVLADSVLFPEGGGQPWDTGTIGDADVISVENVGGKVVHTTTSPVEVGAAVTVKVNWARRWDLMQQHSAQHLVTATAIKLFGYQTDAWNLGDELSFLDLEAAAVTAEQLCELETAVNTSIRASLAVNPRWIMPDDPELATIRCRGLPDDVVGEIRVLEIDTIDKNLCCGTHVQTTKDLQLVKLLKMEKAKKCTRIWFVAGDRALDQLGLMFGRQSRLTSMLAVAPADHADQVERISKSGRDNEKLAKALTAEIAQLTAVGLVKEIATGKTVVSCHRELGDMDFMKAVTGAMEPRGEAMLLVTVTSGEGDGGMFMLSGPEDKVKLAGPSIAKIMNGKGGGKGRFQGKVAAISKRDVAVAELEILGGAESAGAE